jgi:hypothetical protein
LKLLLESTVEFLVCDERRLRYRGDIAFGHELYATGYLPAIDVVLSHELV